MRRYGLINLIVKELNVNYTHDRMKEIEIIVHIFSLTLMLRIVKPG
jgi:hypothetical protein